MKLSRVTALVRARRSLFEDALASPAHERSRSQLAAALFNAFGDGAMPPVLRAYFSSRSEVEVDGLRGLIVVNRVHELRDRRLATAHGEMMNPLPPRPARTLLFVFMVAPQ